MRFLKFAAAALWAAMAVAAQAGGRGTPIEPMENIPLETASAEMAERAIRVGAVQRGWIPEVVDANLVRCRLDNRGHLVVVDVPHTANSFSVRYSSSANMDYDPASGTIHRKYNAWVANLVQDIQRAAFTLGPEPIYGVSRPTEPVPGPAAAPAPAADEPAVSAEERLRKLADLHEKGLVTDEEYAARRKEIIDSL